MSGSSQPEQWDSLIAGYVLGNLDPEEAQALEQLRAAHPEINERIARLQDVDALMAEVPEIEPPAFIRAGLLQSLEHPDRYIPTPAEPTLNPHRSGFLSRLGLGATIAGAIAALLIAALLTHNYRLRQALQSAQQEIASLEQELQATQSTLATYQNRQPSLFTLEGTDNAAATGSLVVNTPQTALITVHNLPALPPGQTYRVWQVTQQAEPIFYGQFETDAQGNAQAQLSVPRTTALDQSQILITAEEASAPPQPAGPVVMQSVS